MDNQTIGDYTNIPYATTTTSTWVNWIETLIETKSVTHKDIPVFKFRPLEEIRSMLQKAGYGKKEVEGTISGLSELPEYASQNRSNKTSGR